MDSTALSHLAVPLDRILLYLQPEPFVVLGVACLAAWVFYRLALRSVNEERHGRLRNDFRNLVLHYLCAFAVSAAFWVLTKRVEDPASLAGRSLAYVGIVGLVWLGIAFLKVARFFLFEYLFFLNKRVGVPVLLVNLSTLVLSIVLLGWLLAGVFAVNLAPLFATSAVVSIVLGLALQETLGNLFSGVALQFDKPYGIDDWIEIQSGPNKWSGRVKEITWRATVLVALGDETITIPNRVIGQAQVANFSARERPFCRVHAFRFPYGTDVEKARAILLSVAGRTKGVRSDLAPHALVRELHESWIELRLVYSIEDYGNQYLIVDELLSAALRELDRAGLPLASPRLALVGREGSPRNA